MTECFSTFPMIFLYGEDRNTHDCDRQLTSAKLKREKRSLSIKAPVKHVESRYAAFVYRRESGAPRERDAFYAPWG